MVFSYLWAITSANSYNDRNYFVFLLSRITVKRDVFPLKAEALEIGVGCGGYTKKIEYHLY